MNKNVSYDGENVSGIGYLLGTTRVSLGLSRADVCNRLGISKSFYQNVENGVKPLPAKYVPKLCRLLKLYRPLVAGLVLMRSSSYRKAKKVL